MRIRTILLASLPLAAFLASAPAGRAVADGHEDPPAEAAPAVAWTDDIAEAAKVAAAEKRDLLLLFCASEWSEATRKFEADVLSKPEFAAFAKGFVPVRLEFPRTDAARAKVKDIAENERIAGVYGVDDVPAVLFTLPGAEAWARLDFDGEDAAKWVASASFLREKTRPQLVEAIEVSKAFPESAGEARVALVRRAIELLEHSYDASAWRRRVFAAAAGAADVDADAQLGLLTRAMYLLTDFRGAPPELRAAARKADPKNALAMRERAVFLDALDVDSEDAAAVRAALKDIESLLRECEVTHDWVRLGLYQAAAVWSWQVTREPSRAKLYAKMLKGVAKPDDATSAKIVQLILEADGKWTDPEPAAGEPKAESK